MDLMDGMDDDIVGAMGRQKEILRWSFWICETLVIAIPFFFLRGWNNLNAGDLMVWLFAGGMALLPIASIAMWKIDRKLMIAGLLTFAFGAIAALSFFNRYGS
jgi:hypothetical protein